MNLLANLLPDEDCVAPDPTFPGRVARSGGVGVPESNGARPSTPTMPSSPSAFDEENDEDEEQADTISTAATAGEMLQRQCRIAARPSGP